MKTNLSHVAKLAGVSMATVDRVINERGGVSPATVERVVAAARSIGLRRVIPDVYRRSVSVEFILENDGSPFSKLLHNTIKQVANRGRSGIVFRRQSVGPSNPRKLAQLIRNVCSDSVVLICRDSPDVVDAINDVAARGVPVVTMANDIPSSSRFKHVGVDNFSSGRTAAYFMSLMMRGPDPHVVVCGDLSIRAVAERVSGFQTGLEDHFRNGAPPHIKFITRHQELADTIRRSDNLGGLYVTHSDVAKYAQILRHTGAQIPFLAHELTPTSEELLASGSVSLLIDQNMRMQIDRSLDELAHHFGLTETERHLPEVPFTLHSPENPKAIALNM